MNKVSEQTMVYQEQFGRMEDLKGQTMRFGGNDMASRQSMFSQAKEQQSEDGTWANLFSNFKSQTFNGSP
jgi:hypothetical protein